MSRINTEPKTASEAAHNPQDFEPFEYGTAPRGGWAKLTPELFVSDLSVSQRFWTEMLGFQVAYRRPGFLYLERPEGCQIMLCERSAKWETGEMEPPYGRGVLLQVFVDSISQPLEAIRATGQALYLEPREVWRRMGDYEGGKHEFAVQDPDGYLVLMAADLGRRALSSS